MASSYARFLWFLLLVSVAGEISFILAATGAVSMDVFSLMPLASRELFLLLAVACPFAMFYFWLLATRNFEDLAATSTGIELPGRNFREMVSDDRREVSYDDVEAVTFLDRRGAQYVEIRFRPAPGRRASLLLPSLWIPDEPAFAASLKDHVVVVRSRPLREPATSR